MTHMSRSSNQSQSWIDFLILLLLMRLVSGNIDKIRNCGNRDICLNRPVAYLQPPQDMAQKVFGGSPCYCDHNCSYFGDCCADKPNLRLGDARINGIPWDEWTCRAINDIKAVYLVSKCKSETQWATMCSRIPTSSDYHYSLDIPVYSINTGNYYENIYCALCHKDSEQLEHMNISVRCNADNITKEMLLKEGVYQPGLRTWLIGNISCTINIDRHVGNHGRSCVPAVAECPASWNDLGISASCNKYQLLVRDSKTIYKNPHCAICNGVDPSNLICWRDYWAYREPYLPSLSMVMDFNWDFKTCKIPQVWDGLYSECRELPCKECDNVSEDSSPKNSNSLSLKIEGYMTVVCLIISILCLICHNIIFYSLPKQKNLPSRILSSLSSSLILAQTLFLGGVTPIFNIPYNVCRCVAISIHFFFLLSFFWMNVMSIDIWHTFSNICKRRFLKRGHTGYTVYAWSGSLIVTSAAVVADFTNIIPNDYKPNYGALPGICWFANRLALGIFLYMPICFILLINIGLFSLTVYWFQKQRDNSQFSTATGRKEYTRFWLYVKLSTIMGITWGFGMIASFAERPDFWYVFILFNGLQGAFIFLMFDLKSNILSLFFDRFGLNILKDPKLNKDNSTQSSKLSASQISKLATSKV